MLAHGKVVSVTVWGSDIACTNTAQVPVHSCVGVSLAEPWENRLVTLMLAIVVCLFSQQATFWEIFFFCLAVNWLVVSRGPKMTLLSTSVPRLTVMQTSWKISLKCWQPRNCIESFQEGYHTLSTMTSTIYRNTNRLKHHHARKFWSTCRDPGVKGGCLL